MTQRKEFRAYMKAANRTSGNHVDNHLSEAQMIAYCRNEMSAAEHEAAQDHLVGCESCIVLFRNARDFLEPARAGEKEVTTAETKEAWQSLLQHVQTSSSADIRRAESTVVEAEFQRTRDKKFLSDSRISLALAASLLISFSALGWLGWRYWQERQARRQAQEVALQLENKQRELQQRLAQLEQNSSDQLEREREQRLAAEAKRDQLQAELAAPRQGGQNIPVFTAILSSARGGADDVRVRFPRAVKAARLRLIINKPYEFPEYAIELFDHRGKMVRKIAGLRPAGDEGALSFRVDRASLSEGKYRLRLFGGTAKKPLGEYGLSVTADR